MTREQVPQPEPDDGRFAFPLPSRLLAIEGVQPLALRVVEVGDLGPRMRRIRLEGLSDAFSHRAGQDVMLVLSAGERPLSRRYTIRSFDPASRILELNVVAHGVHGPGAQWAASTQPGERINGVGPRGKIFVNPSADWHLFLGDESAAAASLAMLEALPAGSRGFACIEVATPSDNLAVASDHDVKWLHRGPETPAWASDRLVKAMQEFELPPGRGHVYFAGEVKVVAAIQRAALARGLAPEQLSPKAYWGRGKANANNGEPEREPAAASG